MARNTAPVLLVLAGSFNPPHMRHLRCMELARETLRKQSRTVLGGLITPTHDDYRKHKSSLISHAHRYAMVQLATQGSWIDSSAWEGEQEGWTTTIDMLEALQERARQEHSTPDLVTMLVCGADLLESFNVPGLWADAAIEKILTKHGLVVINRPGSKPEEFIAGHEICSKHADSILIADEMITNDVSSSILRTLIARGSSIRYLTVDAVCDYIADNNLYKEE